MAKPATKESVLQVIDGFNFRLYPSEKYFKGWCEINGIKKKTTAHRYVWEKNFGEIPKGFHIHHKDEDKTNNSIENLALVDPKQHSKLHYNQERADKLRRNLEQNARPKAVEWHKSKEGHEWHKQHSRRTFFGDVRKLVCPNCENDFETDFKAKKYCSTKCKVEFNNRKKKTLRTSF